MSAKKALDSDPLNKPPKFIVIMVRALFCLLILIVVFVVIPCNLELHGYDQTVKKVFTLGMSKDGVWNAITGLNIQYVRVFYENRFDVTIRVNLNDYQDPINDVYPEFLFRANEWNLILGHDIESDWTFYFEDDLLVKMTK